MKAIHYIFHLLFAIASFCDGVARARIFRQPYSSLWSVVFIRSHTSWKLFCNADVLFRVSKKIYLGCCVVVLSKLEFDFACGFQRKTYQRLLRSSARKKWLCFWSIEGSPSLTGPLAMSTTRRYAKKLYCSKNRYCRPCMSICYLWGVEFSECVWRKWWSERILQNF